MTFFGSAQLLIRPNGAWLNQEDSQAVCCPWVLLHVSASLLVEWYREEEGSESKLYVFGNEKSDMKIEAELVLPSSLCCFFLSNAAVCSFSFVKQAIQFCRFVIQEQANDAELLLSADTKKAMEIRNALRLRDTLAVTLFQLDEQKQTEDRAKEEKYRTEEERRRRAETKRLNREKAERLKIAADRRRAERALRKQHLQEAEEAKQQLERLKKEQRVETKRKKRDARLLVEETKRSTKPEAPQKAKHVQRRAAPKIKERVPISCLLGSSIAPPGGPCINLPPSPTTTRTSGTSPPGGPACNDAYTTSSSSSYIPLALATPIPVSACIVESLPSCVQTELGGTESLPTPIPVSIGESFTSSVTNDSSQGGEGNGKLDLRIRSSERTLPLLMKSETKYATIEQVLVHLGLEGYAPRFAAHECTLDNLRHIYGILLLVSPFYLLRLFW